MFYIQLTSLGGYFKYLSQFWRYFGCFGWQKYPFFSKFGIYILSPLLPILRHMFLECSYIFWLICKNGFFFWFGGSLGPVWLVHNLNLLNLDRLTKLPQFLLDISKEGAPCLPSSWIDFSLCCWFCVIWSKSYYTLAVMSSGFSGHVSFYLHKAHSAVELNLLFTFVWLRS